jgi:arabinogalactan oligomer/maltooligosaccharide transport system permease protein
MAARAGRGFYLKLVLMAIVDALGIYGLFALASNASWIPFGIMLVALLIVNVVYFHPKLTPSKYLVPGLMFLLLYQIYSVLFSGYIAFTNYGDGHNSTKDDAVAAMLTQNEARLPNSPQYPLTIAVQGDTVAFLVVNPDTQKTQRGTAASPLADAPDATVVNGRVTADPGWRVLKFVDILNRGQAFQDQVTQLRVPRSDNAADGSIRTQDAQTAFVFQSTLRYDAGADTVTNTKTNVVYRDNGKGNFAGPDGSVLTPGWKVAIGFTNFSNVLSDKSIRGPFLGVFVWTFAFSILVVLLSFAVGLFLAVVLNDTRLRGRRIYRSLLLLPYAFPAFLSALVWQGLLNKDFGWINQILLGGSHIDWLGDPWLARLSVIVVNCWLGFPYMFLVATGALQAIPADLVEAGAIDGASPWQIFRRLKFPLLMVSLAPLLITSFAYNFNNFNTIFLLTGGGPKDLSASVNVGSTDILITFVYKLAFGGVNRQYGLASAISIIIFIVVAAISAISFRKTRVLEDLS